MVTSWPLGWSGLQSKVSIIASDMLKWPSRRPSLGPLLVEEVHGDGAQLYYPLSDPSSSVSGGDQSGSSRPSLTIRQSGAGGTLEFGTGTGPPSDELTTPTFTPASSSAGKSLQCRITPLLTSDGSTGTPIPGTQVWETWFSTLTSGRCILKLSTGAAAAFEAGVYFLLESGTGRLQSVEFFFGGSITTTLTAVTPNWRMGSRITWCGMRRRATCGSTVCSTPSGLAPIRTWRC